MDAAGQPLQGVTERVAQGVPVCARGIQTSMNIQGLRPSALRSSRRLSPVLYVQLTAS